MVFQQININFFEYFSRFFTIIELVHRKTIGVSHLLNSDLVDNF